VREIRVGDRQYRVLAVERAGEWTARAEHVATGECFGIECTGRTGAAAIERLARWLPWQHEHATALDALQEAERAYHRTVAGSAFASPTEGPTAIEMQKEAFNKVEAARVRLDEIRAASPERLSDETLED
jgi:hypothetical protein